MNPPPFWFGWFLVGVCSVASVAFLVEMISRV